MGGSTGTSTVGGSMGSSAPKAAGQSSAQSYAPPPPVTAYQPRSQQSYGNVGSSKSTSQPAYGGTGYNTPRLPQMVQPQSRPGTVYGGPLPTAYPAAPAATPGAVYSGPSPTTASTAWGSVYGGQAPAPASSTSMPVAGQEDYTAAPVVNRAPIVEAPPAPPPSTETQPKTPETPAQPSGPVGDGSMYYDAKTGTTRFFNGYDDNGNPQYADNNWKRGGKVGDKNSTDTVSRALSLVRGVVKKDKK